MTTIFSFIQHDLLFWRTLPSEIQLETVENCDLNMRLKQDFYLNGNLYREQHASQHEESSQLNDQLVLMKKSSLFVVIHIFHY